MDLQRLKHETAPEHRAVEAMLPLGSELLNVDEYRRVLASFHQIIAGWDQWSEEHAPEHLRALLQERHRAPMLERDLQMLHGEPASRESIERFVKALGAPVSEAEFLGRMYVVEGSTLGGQYIARMVEDKLHLSPGEGDAYFRGYGDRTGTMWKQFQAVLLKVPEESAANVIAGARFMFEAFARVFRANLAPAAI